MAIKTSSAAQGPENAEFQAIFEALPPLGSTAYLRLLETASVFELPAQVLARAFRELALSGSVAAANATLGRLLGSSGFDYLKPVRIKARHMVARGQYAYDKDDLVQVTAMEIAKTLPTTRGQLAEIAWATFSIQRLFDAWRIINGRRGEKFKGRRVEPTIDDETGETIDPLDRADLELPPWHVQHWKSELPWLEDFVQRVVASIADATIQSVARDQFSADPSPISARTSAGGKPPLTEQLGLDRFQISRALRSAKARLAAELLSQSERDLDFAPRLEELLQQLGKPAPISEERADDSNLSERVFDLKTPLREKSLRRKTFPDEALSPRMMTAEHDVRDVVRKLK